MYKSWRAFAPSPRPKHVAVSLTGHRPVKRASIASRTAIFTASAIACGTLYYSSEFPAGGNHNKFSFRDFSSKAHDGASESQSRQRDYPHDAREADDDSKPKSGSTWTSISDSISKVALPDWAKVVPAFLEKLQHELAMEPGTLADEMWQEANDPEVNPEIIWEASVRVSDELCKEEKEFLEKRKRHTTKALAHYLGISEAEIDPEDVPTIAMCGSGGGLRALVAGASSYAAAQEAGLFDCVTYTAGVSGSCWLQALYFSSLTGQRADGVLKHLKNRLGVHIAYPPPLLKLMTSAPTNKFLLAGGFEKYMVGKDSDFGIVDVYGVLLGARLLVPKGELAIDYRDLKLSDQRRYLDEGHHPLPIYTSVRHEIPRDEASKEATGEAAQEKARKEAWFQWFEETPYEFWCEELQAGIPSWAVGRKFDGGRSVFRDNGLGIPEIRVPLLMGIWGSAFCATLSHYYHEIRPLVMGLSGFRGIDDMINERNEDLIKIHPVDPGKIPNYLLGMRNKLPSSTPESIHKAEYLQLMDAGMSNNLPIYPLLRPGRDVDIMIVFDASADVKQDNWLKVAEGYARQRQIKGWPVGTGWPESGGSAAETARELDAADQATATEAHEKLEKAEHEQAEAKSTNTNGESEKSPSKDDHNGSSEGKSKGETSKDLGFCNVWVGTTTERTYDSEPPQSPRVDSSSEDWRLMEPDAGIAVVYFPFLPNPDKVNGVDPNTSDFMSTWNSIYTPEQVEKVKALAEANFKEGDEITKRTVRAVYERKKKQRLERQQKRDNDANRFG